MPVPGMSATVTLSPLNPTRFIVFELSLVNTIGSVVVVPSGIAWFNLTTTIPLKGCPTVGWLLKSNATCVVPTLTLLLDIVGIPNWLTLILVGKTCVAIISFIRIITTFVFGIGRSHDLLIRAFAKFSPFPFFIKLSLLFTHKT